MKMKKYLFPMTLLLLGQPLQAQRMTDGDTHSPSVQKVVEYVPAPGQFVNVHPTYEDGDTYQTMLDKCTARLSSDDATIVSLGGYGGYVTFCFDHSIANIAGKPDVVILGNAYTGNAEPGIVMVSKDENGNGIPDDAWYELKGSADDDGTAVYQYRITYQRPTTETRDTEQSTISRYITIEQYIPWSDNKGGSGYMHKNSYHNQVYFPLWVSDNELTFQGTLLPKNAVNTAAYPAENWLLSEFAWGYADNKGNSDVAANSFDFDNAVDDNRQPVDIDFIDFVRVYNAENQDCGWIGETSTEVNYAYDAHLEESIEAIKKHEAGISTLTADTPAAVVYHTLDGKRLDAPQPGLLLVRMGNGSVKKIFLQ